MGYNPSTKFDGMTFGELAAFVLNVVDDPGGTGIPAAEISSGTFGSGLTVPDTGAYTFPGVLNQVSTSPLQRYFKYGTLPVATTILTTTYYQAWDGVAYGSAASIIGEALGTAWSATDHRGGLAFQCGVSGTTTLATMLRLSDFRLYAVESDATANGPKVAVSKSRGTPGSELYPNSGDNLGIFEFRGYDEAASGFAAQSQVKSDVVGTWTASNRASDITFWTTLSGATTMTKRWQMSDAGYFVSTLALATPSALAATSRYSFASTVSGGVLMGYGTTGDVTLKNRAGTDVLYIGPNTTDITITGPVSASGTIANPAGSVRYFGSHGGSALNLVNNVPTNGGHLWRVNGTLVTQISISNLQLGGSGAAFTVNGSTASGADTTSGVITIQGALGTGAGAVGGIVFQVPVTHGSDSVAQTATTALTIGATTVTSVKVAGAFSCNGTNPQTAFASGGALNAYGAGVNGLDTGANMAALHAMVVAIRAALVADGIMS